MSKNCSVDSLCPYCGVGCQVRYHVEDGIVIRTDGLNGPSNRGRLCVKGRFGHDYASHADRLTRPLIRRDDAPKQAALSADPLAQFREASWEEALDRAAAGFARLKAQHGPEVLAGFGSAKGSNEEGYLFQRLIRTGFGTNSVDHCARLCHSSSLVALIDQIGSGGVTAAFTQCENTNVMMVVGSNPSRNHPVAASFFRKAARNGTKLIVIDPRRSEISEGADLVITHKAGSDVVLFNAISRIIIEEDMHDGVFLRNRTKGFPEFRESVRHFTPEYAEAETGVPAAQIKAVAHMYGRAKSAMIFWGMGITQHIHGVRNARCLVNLALLTGNVGRPGTGLHPLRGQNNVQGVCDMGILPGLLPGYAAVAKPEERARVEKVWQGETIPANAGMTMIEVINAVEDGGIRGLFFMGENPAMSDPDAHHARAALSKLEHLVVQDIFLTESAQYADVVLPASSLLEKSGSFTNTNRHIQISRPVLDLPGEARQDWWILQELARRLGLNWNFSHPSEIWEEVRTLWPAIKGVSWSRLERDGWCQYPCASENEPGKDVLFGDRFPTADGLGKIVPVAPVEPAELTDRHYPLILITGRILEHWHTGSMSRRSAVLDTIEPGPLVYLSSVELIKLGISSGDRIKLSSRRGTIEAQCRVDPGLAPGTVFMPFCYFEAAANVLTNAALDPQSKIPEFKYCAVRLETTAREDLFEAAD
ncbi:MAG: formate dehydrogenase subunit alpha [Rhodospirillaceae bacterium]